MKKNKKQAQHRAATETVARKLIDPLLHSLGTYLVDPIRNRPFPILYNRLAHVSKRMTSFDDATTVST